MTTQWTGSEDPAETARWEAEKAGDAVHHHVAISGFTPDQAALLERLLKDTRKSLPVARSRESWNATRRALAQAHRTSTLAITTTAFISGALAALGVVAVAAGWHWLGAR